MASSCSTAPHGGAECGSFPLIPRLLVVLEQGSRLNGQTKPAVAAALSAAAGAHRLVLVDATAASPSAALPDWLAVCGLTGELTIACSRPAEGKQVEDESGAGSREQLKAALIAAVSLSCAACRVEGVEDEETLLDLLDAGVSRAIIACDERAAPSVLHSLLQQLRPAASASASFPVPASRLAIAVTVQDEDDAAAPHRVVRCGSRLTELLGEAEPPLSAFMDGLQHAAAEFVICPARADRPPSASLLAMLSDWRSLHPEVRLTLQCDAAASVDAVHGLSALGLHSTVSVAAAAACRSGSLLSVETVGGWLGSVVARHCRSDRADGLVSTVVVDDGGVALGLVYSSPASVVASCSSQRGVYWSRSRQQLWRKGDTSGCSQRLLQLTLDCDGDALRFMVEQEGAGFCHLQRWTCWPTQGSGLRALSRTLAERRRRPQPLSYTARLLQDDGLLNSKLLEEAAELLQADTQAEVAAEAADLLFFTAVRLCKADVSWAQVERCLELRSTRLRRRAGNAKPPQPQPQPSAAESSGRQAALATRARTVVQVDGSRFLP